MKNKKYFLILLIVVVALLVSCTSLPYEIFQSSPEYKPSELNKKVVVNLEGWSACETEPYIYEKEAAVIGKLKFSSRKYIGNDYRRFECNVRNCQYIPSNPIEIDLVSYNTKSHRSKDGEWAEKTMSSPIFYPFTIRLWPYYNSKEDCEKSVNAKMFEQEYTYSGTAIILSTGGGKGTTSYRVAIYDDGTVVYHGERFVYKEGMQTSKIPQEKVKDLIEEFNKANFFSLRDEYEEFVTDIGSETITMIANGKVKTVMNYGRTAPRKFYELIDKIDETANTKQWITDECDIISYKERSGQVVSEEDKSNFPCEENKNCKWKGITRYVDGVTPKTFYSCCPKKEEREFLPSRCR